jgi:drug/metabolite transporter (DMT)-like permease
MKLDRQYLLWALGYAVVGMCLGIYMAKSLNHSQLVTHAHILLVGFVVSFAYALIHRLWLAQPGRLVARLQFILHQLSAVILLSGLLLLYGGVLPDSTLGPILGIASVGVLGGALLMIYMLLKSQPARTAS